MTINIISAYISEDNNVIAIAVGESYKFPYRLNREKREKLLAKVLTARQINTEIWKVI